MRKSSIVAAISGNVIEWYDFSLYIFLAPVIAHNFFPAGQEGDSLLSTFLVFALSFFIRPLGSLVFGHFGDKIGRALTLKITIFLVSLSTLIIALLPNYQSVGMYASALLLLCRVIQGFCIGGEFAGSMIYLTEMAPDDKRALTSCMTNNGSNFGIFLATTTAAIFSNSMSESAFYDYGWRFPFLIGGIIGLTGLWLRRNLAETTVFTTMHAHEKLATVPIATVLSQQKMQVFNVFLLLFMSATGSYVLMNLMSTYLTEFFHFSLANALTIQSVYNILTLFLVTIAAKCSDLYGRKLVLMVAAVGYIIFSIPCFYLLQLTGLWICLLPLVIFYSIEQSTTPVAMVEMFPAKTRYTGISMGYNLAMALVGGTAPFVNTWLVAKFNQPLLIAYYLVAGALVSLVAVKHKLKAEFGLNQTLLESK